MTVFKLYRRIHIPAVVDTGVHVVVDVVAAVPSPVVVGNAVVVSATAVICKLPSSLMHDGGQSQESITRAGNGHAERRERLAAMLMTDDRPTSRATHET